MDSDDDQPIGEEFGQEETLTRRINRLLEEYTDGFAVPKELIQNADDAGATEVKFLYDERTNDDAMTGLLDEGMRECQGPALWVYNDAEFKDKDFENIIKLNGATKEQDTTTIGKFGLGFNAVYNLTDVPSFVSRNYIVFFDPHTVYLGKAIRDKRKPGIKIDLNRNLQRLRNFRNQFRPFNGIFGCDLRLNKEDNSYHGTLFRFPLRTRKQAEKSEIKELFYDNRQMKELLRLFVSGAKSLLLFTQNVRQVSIFHVPKENPKVQLMFRVTKSLAEPGVLRKISLPITLPSTASKLSNTDQVLLEQCNVLQASSGAARRIRGQRTVAEGLLLSSLTIDIDCSLTPYGKLFFHNYFNYQVGNETWLVTSSMGNGQALAFSEKEKNLLPSAGVAVRVVPDDLGSYCPRPHVNGGLFCYLPLPISSGLPVHVNGAFAVDSSRRHLHVKIGDDKSFLGVEWNNVLLEDPVCSAYFTLLEDLKHLLPAGAGNFKYDSLWPKARVVQKSCRPVVNAFYKGVVSGGHCVFWDGIRWVAFKKIVFLHPNLRVNAEIGDASFEVFRLVMKQVKVVEMPRDVFESFQDCGWGKDIHAKCFDKSKFFRDVFFPNISSIPSHLRDTLVLHMLDSRSLEFDRLLNMYSCIPVSPHGEKLKRPGYLVHPQKSAASLFFPEDGRFPYGDDDTFQDPFRLARLEKLGMYTDDLQWEEMADRAESIQRLYTVDREAALDRVENFLEFLQTKLKRKNAFARSAAQLPALIHQRLTEAHFLPVLQKPTAFPLPWKGEEFPGLASPKDVFSEDDKYLVCCTKPVVGVVLSEDVKGLLQLDEKDVSIGDVFAQLDAAIATKLEYLNPSEYHEVERLCNTVYTVLQENLGDHEDLYKRKFILVGRRFLSAEQVAFKLSADCVPYLFELPEEFCAKYRKLMMAAGVRDAFQEKDFIISLRQIKQVFGKRKLDSRSLLVVVNLACQLSELLETSWNDLNHTTSMYGDIYLPDSKSIMRPVHELCIKNCPWIPDDTGVVYANDKIPWPTCLSLGVKTRREEVLQSHAVGISFGQREKLVNRLKRILTGYPCEKEILKELLQNADDAQATKICFIKDPRNHPDKRVFEDTWKALQGPALCVYNNNPFTKADIEGIQNLGEGSKGNDPNKTGQYGIGFNAVYHLTDVPSFKSKGDEVGDVLGVFDPHCMYVPGATSEEPGRLFKDTATLKKQFPDVFSCYLEDYFPSEKATMFRFPLRSEMMAAQSKISSTVVTLKTLDVMMEDLKKELFEVLLFVNNVQRIELCAMSKRTGKLFQTYSVQVKMSDKDQTKRQQFADFVRNIGKNLTEGGTVHPNSIPVTTCSYILNMEDSLGNKESWFIVQQIGFNDKVNSRIVEAFRKRDLGMLPRGGVACLLESTRTEDRRKKAYCFLPLPFETDLPVHINGHFALDHEARRNLWRDERGGYRSDWNNALLSDVIASCYLTLLDEVRSFLGLPVKKDSNICLANCSQNVVLKQISVFERLFPCHSLIEPYWETLVHSVYQKMDEGEFKLVPVIRKTPQNASASTTTMVQITWLPPTGHGKSQAYFSDLHTTGYFADWKGPSEPPLTKDLRKKERERFQTILLETGFNLVAFSTTVLEQLRLANVDALTITPNTVMQFYKTVNSQQPLCKIGRIPSLVSETPFQTVLDVLLVLRYCKGDKAFLEKLPGLPLLVTQDNVLCKFDNNYPKFLSPYQDILPESPNIFVHKDLQRGIFSSATSLQSSTFQTFDTEALATFLPYTLLTEEFGTGKCISWCPKQDEIPNQRWIFRVWTFLCGLATDCCNDLQPDATNEEKTRRIKEMLMPLSEWSILPVTITTCYRRPHGLNLPSFFGSYRDTEHFLKPLKLAGSVLDLSEATNSKLREVLRKLGLPELNSTVLSNPDIRSLMYLKSESADFARDLVGSLKKPSSLIESLTQAMESNPSTPTEKLTPADCEIILQYFKNNVECLSDADKKILKKLPLFASLHGGPTRVDGPGVFIFPTGIPKEGVEHITGVLFLEPCESLSSLYKFLDLEGSSSYEMYYKFILKYFKDFSDEARILHLQYIRTCLLPRQEDTPELQRLLECLRTTEFIPSVDGTLKTASSFHDPENPVFTAMLTAEAFPLPPFDCPYEWLPFLRKVGLIQIVSRSDFLNFARKVEREAVFLGDDQTRKKSEVLVNHLFARENVVGENLLKDVCGIRFLAPDPPTSALLDLYPQYFETGNDQPCFIAFEGAVADRHEGHVDIMWSTAHVLPSWADPRNHYMKIPRKLNSQEYLEKCLHQLQIVTKVPVDVVISHCQNICYRHENDRARNKISSTRRNTIMVVMEEIYSFLQRHAHQRSGEMACLEHTPCILVEQGGRFLPPKQVVLELYEILEIKPFLYRLPPELGKFQKLFLCLGCSTSVTASHYATVLELIHKQCGEKKLHPNEISQVFKAMKGLLQLLQGDSEAISPFSKLYLPATSMISRDPLPVTLHESTKLMFNDAPRYQKRIQSFDQPFVVDNRTAEMDVNSLMVLLPQDVRPHMLSSVVEERLNEPKLCEVINTGNVFKEKVSSPQFRSGVIRLLRHENRGKKTLDETLAADIERKLQSIEFFGMEKIVTTLFHLQCPIPESTRVVDYFIEETMESENEAWKVYVNPASNESEVVLAVANVIEEACGGLLKETAKFIPVMLLAHPRDIRSLLDKENIIHGESDDSESIFPDPGDFIPIEDHHLLNEAFEEFEQGEYVGYELHDPSLEMEEGNGTYIYAVILEEVTTDELSGILTRKYSVDIGQDSGKVVAEAADLYKFHRLDVVACSAIVRLDRPNDQHKTTRSGRIFDDISNVLEEAWKLSEEKRRKVVKRLFLRWHPDKNPGDEEFCRTVFQHLQSEIARLVEENKNWHDPYDSLFEYWGTRARRHQTQREQYGRNFVEHYGSSGTRSWRTVPPSFATKNPQPGETKRWLRQADADLAAAENDISSANPSYEWACFKCHQAAEKAIKAAQYSIDAEKDNMHNLPQNCLRLDDSQLTHLSVQLEGLVGDSTRMRYPDRMHYPSIPNDVYSEEMAFAAHSLAKEILDHVKEHFC